jgi:hypothetical protein
VPSLVAEAVIPFLAVEQVVVHVNTHLSNWEKVAAVATVVSAVGVLLAAVSPW